MEDRIRLLERRDIDELIILDVSGGPPRFDEVRKLTAPLFCPITVGGGIKSTDDVGRLLANGADKIAICSEIEIIEEASRKFGAQAISVHLVSDGLEDARVSSVSRAQEFESRGAGEIILTCAEHDGTMDGYAVDLIRSVARAVDIPVVACGGCGSYEHMKQALDAGAHAVAVGALFQFREATPKGAARFLHAQGYQTRI